MKLKYALQTLKKELELLNTPIQNEEDEDLIDAVIYMQKTSDLKLGIQILKQFIVNAKTLDLL